jgi:hypothetical protein
VSKMHANASACVRGQFEADSSPDAGNLWKMHSRRRQPMVFCGGFGRKLCDQAKSGVELFRLICVVWPILSGVLFAMVGPGLLIGHIEGWRIDDAL